MPRTISASHRFASTQIAPGVFIERFHPGGRFGPNREVKALFPGGQCWSETMMLGDAKADPFQLAVPDIRLPANQLWPLHWHDCWVAVVILEGDCMIGDWWMKPGDVLITTAGVEYGPLLIGPDGCRMFEIFAKLHLQSGGYGPEYRDHPTLKDGAYPFNFTERANVNRRNEGRQSLPIDGVAGLVKGKLTHGSHWDLGDADDPERGVMNVHGLAAGEAIAAHCYSDWHTLIVMQGQLQSGNRALNQDDYLLVQPNRYIDALRAGPDGALVIEVVRTARGLQTVTR